MNEVQQATQIARDISDYGIMIVICAFFLILSGALMIVCFKWFKSIIEKMMSDYSDKLIHIQDTDNKIAEIMVDIAEGLIPETQLRIKNISNVYFDLAVEQICRLIERLREENHIDDRKAEAKKIRTLLRNIHEDRKSRFDCFRFRGKPLSMYCNIDWVEQVAKVVEDELYDNRGTNNRRSHTNVKAAYDNIKLDFYHRLNA